MDTRNLICGAWLVIMIILVVTTFFLPEIIKLTQQKPAFNFIYYMYDILIVGFFFGIYFYIKYGVDLKNPDHRPLRTLSKLMALSSTLVLFVFWTYFEINSVLLYRTVSIWLAALFFYGASIEMSKKSSLRRKNA